MPIRRVPGTKWQPYIQVLVPGFKLSVSCSEPFTSLFFSFWQLDSSNFFLNLFVTSIAQFFFFFSPPFLLWVFEAFKLSHSVSFWLGGCNRSDFCPWRYHVHTLYTITFWKGPYKIPCLQRWRCWQLHFNVQPLVHGYQSDTPGLNWLCGVVFFFEGRVVTLLISAMAWTEEPPV